MKNNGESENIKDVKKDNEKQSQRFVETAEQLNVDKTGKLFELAIESVVTKKEKD